MSLEPRRRRRQRRGSKRCARMTGNASARLTEGQRTCAEWRAPKSAVGLRPTRSPDTLSADTAPARGMLLARRDPVSRAVSH
jgi:hypothetical protein